MSKTIKIVGVPEHFNLPWHMCIEDGEFDAVGIDLQWTDVPEGTGKMCQMLREGEADIAVILTEGIVKDITAGNPCKIVQVYVQKGAASPGQERRSRRVKVRRGKVGHGLEWLGGHEQNSDTRTKRR